MFKNKNLSTPLILLNLYYNKKITTYTNKVCPNLISLKGCSITNLIPIQFITEYKWTSAVDICALDLREGSKITQHNLFFNYHFNIYLNLIANRSNTETNSIFFANRVWLEREVAETFNVIYAGITDTRPLLLNYGEATGVFLKANKLQPISEIKVSWHHRKLVKQPNTGVEL